MPSHEYKTIVRASAITGFASIANAGLSFLRLKLIAVFAGAQGVGLLGLLTSTIGLVSTATSLGLGSSSVRDVAEAAGKGDDRQVSKTIQTLRRLCWLTGIIGASACVLAGSAISTYTFGSPDRAFDIAVLGICVLLAQVSAGQAALLRGLRRVTQLAYQSIFVSILSLALAGAIFYTLGVEGVVPYMIAAQLATLAGTWWYARGVKIAQEKLSLEEAVVHGRSMISLGLAFQLSNLVGAASGYLVGIMLFRNGGAELNGFYQAAWGSSGAVAGLVLGAMGQDFYPRLAAVAKDPAASIRLINQQCEVGVLMALPLLAGFAALAPILIPALFSAEFAPAAPAVIWFVLGAFGRVVSWPLGYYLMASARGWWFFFTEVTFTSFYLGIAYYLIGSRGLEGAGIAWFILYVVYWLGMSLLVGRLCGHFLGRSAVKLGVIGFLAIGLTSYLGPAYGTILSIPMALLSLRSLVRRVGHDNQLVARLANLPLLGKFILS